MEKEKEKVKKNQKGKGKDNKGEGKGEAHQADGSESQPSAETGQRQDAFKSQQGYSDQDWSQDWWWSDSYATTDQEWWWSEIMPPCTTNHGGKTVAGLHIMLTCSPSHTQNVFCPGWNPGTPSTCAKTLSMRF